MATKSDDPADIAYDLIHDGRLYGQLTGLVTDLERARIDTVAKCRGLQQVGSHRISAPDLLKGDILTALKALQSFVNTCVQQVEDTCK